MGTVRPSAVLKSGWLVVADIHNHGCVSMKVSDRNEVVDVDRVLTGDWHTNKRIANVDEHKAVAKAVFDAKNGVKSLGYSVYAGTYVPMSRGAELQEAISAARTIINLHNSTSKFTSISGGFITFLLAGDEGSAANAIISSAQQTLNKMADAIERADVKALRDTMRGAAGIESMFEASTAGKLSSAMQAAKKTARAITRASKKAGEELAAWDEKIAEVETARIAFAEITLDLNQEFSLPGYVAPDGIEMMPDERDTAYVDYYAGVTAHKNDGVGNHIDEEALAAWKKENGNGENTDAEVPADVDELADDFEMPPV